MTDSTYALPMCYLVIVHLPINIFVASNSPHYARHTRRYIGYNETVCSVIDRAGPVTTSHNNINLPTSPTHYLLIATFL